MLLEDQYGVGDAVDVGEASGIVESVGLRITSIRDARGVLWHVRNGEIVRVGNKSQGWALVVIDVPVGFARVDDATDGAAGGRRRRSRRRSGVGRRSARTAGRARRRAGRPSTARCCGSPRRPRTEAQARVGRELRTRLTNALAEAGIMDAMSAGRVFVRPAADRDEPPAPPADEVTRLT